MTLGKDNFAGFQNLRHDSSMLSLIMKYKKAGLIEVLLK
jgi:hypothetical protein